MVKLSEEAKNEIEAVIYSHLVSAYIHQISKEGGLNAN